MNSRSAHARPTTRRGCRRNDGARVERAAELLAMEEAALSMFTSCAWFFDDIARIETIQVLKYAAFAIELSGDPARLESGLLDRIGDGLLGEAVL